MVYQQKLLVAGLVLATLAACHEQGAPAPTGPGQTLTRPSAQQVAQLMAQTCFATLPDFARFDQAAQAAGLLPGPSRGPARSPYFLPGTTAFVDTIQSPKGTVCVASVESSDSKDAVGKAFLSVARSATGGTGTPQPTSFFALANHMPNGSLVTQDFRSGPGKPDMNILGVTTPIAASSIPFFIYN